MDTPRAILDDIRRNANKVAQLAGDLLTDPDYAPFLADQEDAFRFLRDDMERAVAEIESSRAWIGAQAD